jgi:hypothetical protein
VTDAEIVGSSLTLAPATFANGEGVCPDDDTRTGGDVA